MKKQHLTRQPTRGVVSTFRLRLDDKATLKKLAEKDGMGVSTYIRMIIESWIEDNSTGVSGGKKTGRFKKRKR